MGLAMEMRPRRPRGSSRPVMAGLKAGAGVNRPRGARIGMIATRPGEEVAGARWVHWFLVAADRRFHSPNGHPQQPVSLAERL